MDHMIDIEHVSKDYCAGDERISALADVSMSIPAGSFSCIIGPSGCGKTTLLRIISGLEKPSSGRVMFSGDKNAQFAYVFQDTLLFPWLTVYDNVEVVLKHADVSVKKDRATIEESLDRVGLLKFRDLYPSELSGGMLKRLSIARAIAVRPAVILMDEPFVYLDFQTRESMHNLVLDLYSQEKTTVLFVTHDIREAIILSSHIYVMSSSPGHIKSGLDVPFGYPRDIGDLLHADGFHDIYSSVDSLLREEVKKTFRKEEEYLLEHRVGRKRIR
ncbi:MAG: ABC transporter ATP-binding protein [Candidatus Omnitrophica bacterium]|nr:ABC transporter ATP-binding protein [Candidatus Omnitrophota bacterium]MDD5487664.1 ABC transporter ATP-binding protein [Candidatus Omnitrophota bacterium]